MPTPRHESRVVPAGEVRVAADGRTIEAVVLRYDVIDDYGTMFAPGVFTESLSERMPRIVWSHDWADPIGRWVDYRDTDTELTLIGELDDFDAVPRARQASAQLASGTIDQFSVGFMRMADEAVDPDEVDGRRGVYRITKGQLDEASLVLRGAVPGTHLVAVRSAAGVSVDAALDLARRMQAGEITAEEAKATLELLGGGGEPAPVALPEGDEEDEEPPAEAAELPDDEIDAALAAVGTSHYAARR